MTNKFLVPFCALSLVLAQPLVLFAQENLKQDEWAAVQSIPAESRIEITTKAGKRLKGQLSQVSDTTITIAHKQQPISIDKTDVQKINRLGNGSRVKNFLIGTGIGAGGGAGAAAAALGATGGSDETALVLLIGIGIGAGIGAGIGILTGKGEKRTLVYEAK